LKITYLSNTTPRPNRERLRRREFIVTVSTIPEPALRSEPQRIGEIERGQGGTDVWCGHRCLFAWSAVIFPLSIDEIKVK
jgi:hypothetical protein